MFLKQDLLLPNREKKSSRQFHHFLQLFLDEVRRNHTDPSLVKDGVFGAMMKVDIANDGPVTLEFEAPPPPQRKAGESEPEPNEAQS